MTDQTEHATTNEFMPNTCDEGGSLDFEVCVEPDEFKRNGQFYTVNVEHSVCRQCSDIVIFTEQIKRNDCMLREAWQKIDNLLTNSN